MTQKFTEQSPHSILLRSLDLPALDYLGEGMQCIVFAGPEQTVIKIYDAAIGIDNLTRLKGFYDSLDTNNVNFQTPLIHSIQDAQEKIIVTERRLSGDSPSRNKLEKFSTEELTIYFENYVNVLFELRNIKTNFLEAAEPLDWSGDFFQYKCYPTWQDLLTENLSRKLQQSGNFYQPFIPHYDELTQQLFDTIRQLHIEQYSLIHGDYFPANTMIDDHFQITAVLDFGTFTTTGDPRYDIGLGWIFADMYENVKYFQVKKYVGELIQSRITDQDLQQIKRYILIYSLLSADMYARADANDGHFQWAMRNLNNPDLLNAL